MEVGRGKAARAPVDPYHDGYIFLGWDVEDFSSIMSDTVITAVYRPMDKYTVTFYNEDGTQVGESVIVNEGDPVEATAELPELVGKIFAGWDKQVGKVDRNWPDFEQYKNLSIEELAATTINYKVTATYMDVPVVPYKKNISIEFKQITDSNGKMAYEPVDSIFTESAAKFVSSTEKYAKGVAAEDYAAVQGNFSVAWDGEYIYVYARIFDQTLLSRGAEWIINESEPWNNDCLELHYAFKEEASVATARQAVKVDAYGIRMYANETLPVDHPDMSKFFDEIECKTAASVEANMYYIIFKIPAKVEADGSKLVAANRVSFSEQINDLRSLEDTTNRFNSSSRTNTSTWACFTLGEVK